MSSSSIPTIPMDVSPNRRRWRSAAARSESIAVAGWSSTRPLPMSIRPSARCRCAAICRWWCCARSENSMALPVCVSALRSVAPDIASAHRRRARALAVLRTRAAHRHGSAARSSLGRSDARRTCASRPASLTPFLSTADLTIVGGTSLFRLARHPDAPQRHTLWRGSTSGAAALTWAGDLLRFGLPPDDAGLDRLAAALALGD